MKFSMIFEAQMAFPTRENEQQCIRDCVEQAVLAEAVGFDRVWAVEHHFTDYSFCPDNLLWLAYVGAKTERIKLGTGAVILPWNDPLNDDGHEQLARVGSYPAGATPEGILDLGGNAREWTATGGGW